MSADATSPGRHRRDDGKADEPTGRRRFSRRSRLLATTVLTVVAGAAAFAGPALAAGPPPPPDPENSPAAQAAHAEPVVGGTPCSISTRACVDLDSQRAWLIRDGKVTRGPMRISSGGDSTPTPIGHSNRVYRKEKDYVSKESRTKDGRPAPMPFSTFFADGGIALHGGSPDRSSAGCIHLEVPDAEAAFNDLQQNDKVQVVSAAAEAKHRKGPPPPPPKKP